MMCSYGTFAGWSSMRSSCWMPDATLLRTPWRSSRWKKRGKYTALMSETRAPKKAKLHVFRQETMGEYFRSAAFFEAVARELDPMLEYLKEKKPGELRRSDGDAKA